MSVVALVVLCPGRFKPPIHRRGSYNTVRSYLVPVATVCPRASARIGSLLFLFFIATRPLASPGTQFPIIKTLKQLDPDIGWDLFFVNSSILLSSGFYPGPSLPVQHSVIGFRGPSSVGTEEVTLIWFGLS